ncbi:hypothetical protein DRN73_02905 [Candidatus Pacearchaeota archaeon]|nr:MAG: hypothetical protein DRN73_02905 [Candidatus Pacearchaeota archaeon]
MTEKNYNPQQKEKKAMKKIETAEKKKIAIPEKKNKVEKLIEKKEAKGVEKKQEEKKTEEKKNLKEEKKEVKKKEFAIVNSYSIPISTKKAAAICKFIKGKTIDEAEELLNQVVQRKKAVPIKGEIAHRKGKIMSGIFPKNASEQFIVILKALAGNSNVNGINEPVIVEAVANLAQRPYSRFGRWRKKRTHIMLKAKEKIKEWKKKK